MRRSSVLTAIVGAIVALCAGAWTVAAKSPEPFHPKTIHSKKYDFKVTFPEINQKSLRIGSYAEEPGYRKQYHLGFQNSFKLVGGTAQQCLEGPGRLYCRYGMRQYIISFLQLVPGLSMREKLESAFMDADCRLIEAKTTTLDGVPAIEGACSAFSEITGWRVARAVIARHAGRTFQLFGYRFGPLGLPYPWLEFRNSFRFTR